MVKRIAVMICSAGLVLMTSGLAAAQTADTKKEKVKATAVKTGAAVSDAEITTAVKSKITANKTLSGASIDVDTNDGVVTLSGNVKTAAERSRAVRLARQTKGVKRVEDKLTLETAG